MQPRTRVIIAALSGALVGAVLCGLSGYFLFIQPALTLFARSKYHSLLSESSLTATELKLLRNGELSKLTELLESMMDASLLAAADIEQFNPDWRDRQAEAAISRVREYRSHYPSTQTDSKLQEQIANALASRSVPTAP